jgi:hypothetical protein
MPGMHDVDGRTYVGCGEWAEVEDVARLVLTAGLDDLLRRSLPHPRVSGSDDALPDLTDPCTVGCLLALVREAWSDPCVYAMRLNVRRQIWVVHVPSDRHNIHGEGDTEAAALVAALEAAP